MFCKPQQSIDYGDKHYSERNKNIRSLRKLVEFLDQRHSSVSILGIITHTAMELVCVGFYVWTSQVSAARNIYSFHWNLGVFITEVVLNIIFFLEWIALFFFEEDKKHYLVSWRSLVNLLTSVPMIILGIGALADSRWRSGWVPMYLRVWWISDCVYLLIDYPQIARHVVDIYREIGRFFARLFAVICTCIGTIQIVESCSGNYIDLYNSLYMMVVAFDTLGYGDVTPLTSPARLFMTAFCLVGLCYFIPLFQRLSKIGEMRQTFASYRQSFRQGHRNHVIICGNFSDMAVDILLKNFYAGWRKYLNTCIVLMSPVECTPEAQLTVNLPWFKDRVEVLIGDPVNEIDLKRAGASKADAIFLFGNTRSSAYYHDFDIIAQSMAVGLYDPNLPQHLLLRRGRTVKQIAPYAASALEIERTVHHLLGLSMAHPGIIPLILNLLRTYEPMPLDISLSRHWVEQYEYSLRNDLYGVEVPDALRGREFRVLARLFFEHDVTLIGVLNARNVVQLNPRELVPNAKKLIMIARTMKASREATVEIARKYEHTFGEEMLVAPDPDEYARRMREMRKPQHRYGAGPDSATVGHVAAASWLSTLGAESDEQAYSDDTLINAGGAASPATGGEPKLDVVESLAPVEDAMDLENHFLVIDLSSAKGKDKATRYAQEANLAAVAHDMYHVMRPLRQAYPYSDIVLLSNDVTFTPYFEHYWDPVADANPIKHITGCGLNSADLRRCNLQHCAGCCIFYAGDISRYGSTSAMSMLVVLSIQEILQCTPTFPVIVELEGLANLPLFPPNAEDVRLRSKGEVDFVFEPNFLIGNAISRQMLYPALQRTYFMEEFIDVMDVLISGYSEDMPALSRIPLSVCEAQLDTYEDVVNYCLKVGFLPIALQRLIHDTHSPSINGQRFVLTNPPHSLPVHQDTDIIFYLTPGVLM